MSSNARAALLRSLGHTEAASILEHIDTALEQPAAPTISDGPAQPAQAMTPQRVRAAEGQTLLAALYESCPQLRPDAEPAA
jgi:hypothetical protein